MWFLDFWDFWEFQLVFPPLLTHCVGWCAGAVFVCIRNEGTTVERQVGDGGMSDFRFGGISDDFPSGFRRDSEGFPSVSGKAALIQGFWAGPRGFRGFSTTFRALLVKQRLLPVMLLSDWLWPDRVLPVKRRLLGSTSGLGVTSCDVVVTRFLCSANLGFRLSDWSIWVTWAKCCHLIG